MHLEMEWVDLWQLVQLKNLMVGHGGSSAGSYLANPPSSIPSNCALSILFKSLGASIVVTSTLMISLSRNNMMQTINIAMRHRFSNRNKVVNDETLSSQNDTPKIAKI